MMCLLPAMAAGLIKPKTAMLGMLNPAAAVISAFDKKKKSPAASTTGGMTANYSATGG